MTWPHSCYIYVTWLAKSLLYQACSFSSLTDNRHDISWTKMILWRKYLLAEGYDAICRVGRWDYLQKFGRASCHIAEGIKAASCPFIFHMPQHASQRSSGLMNNAQTFWHSRHNDVSLNRLTIRRILRSGLSLSPLFWRSHLRLSAHTNSLD
jgi:hypothetical protein